MTFDFNVLITYWPALVKGLGYTIAMCFASLPLGFLAGFVLALARLRGGRIIGAVATVYIEVIRNIPFLIQVFLLFFVLPSFGLRLSPIAAGIIALSAYASAYFAEILRGALQSIPRGQTEAGFALGLRFGVIFRNVLLPQVVGYIFPAATNLSITLIKESAILSVITVPELTYMAQDVIGRTFAPIEVFTVIALIYWSLTAALAALSRWLERRLQPHVTASRG